MYETVKGDVMENITKIEKMSNEDIASVFDLYFETQVAKPNQIDEFESSCERDNINDPIVIKVLIIGLAGTPTPDDVKNGKLEGVKDVELPIDNNSDVLKFRLDEQATMSLNTNDYWLFYKMV